MQLLPFFSNGETSIPPASTQEQEAGATQPARIWLAQAESAAAAECMSPTSTESAAPTESASPPACGVGAAMAEPGSSASSLLNERSLAVIAQVNAPPPIAADNSQSPSSCGPPSIKQVLIETPDGLVKPGSTPGNDSAARLHPAAASREHAASTIPTPVNPIQKRSGGLVRPVEITVTVQSDAKPSAKQTANPAAKPPTGGRLDTTALDGLRGIATLHIVIYHIFETMQWGLTGEYNLPNIPGFNDHYVKLIGKFSIGTFYAISGFGLMLGYGKKDIYVPRLFTTAPEGAPKSFDLRGFMYKRLMRLYPTYILANLMDRALMSIKVFSWSAELGWPRIDYFTLDGWSFVLTLFGANSAVRVPWLGWVTFPYDGVSWTITAFLFFYLAFPWVAATIQSLPLNVKHIRFAGALAAALYATGGWLQYVPGEGQTFAMNQGPTWYTLQNALIRWDACGVSCFFANYYSTAWFSITSFFAGACAGWEVMKREQLGLKPFPEYKINPRLADALLLFIGGCLFANIAVANLEFSVIGGKSPIDEGLLYLMAFPLYMTLVSLTFAPKRTVEKDTMLDEASSQQQHLSRPRQRLIAIGRRAACYLLPTEILRSRLLCFIGDVSMPLYLTHITIFRAVSFFLCGLRRAELSSTVAWTLLVLMLLFVIFIGWFLTEFFEKPAADLLHRFLVGPPAPRKITKPRVALYAWYFNLLFCLFCFTITLVEVITYSVVTRRRAAGFE